MAVVQHSSVLPMSKKELFNFLFREEAWERGMPPEFESERASDFAFREKARLKWRMSRHGFSFNWAIVIDRIVRDESVIFVQDLGFFDAWSLTQSFEEHAADSTILTDTVEYQMPMGILGRLTDDLWARKEIMRLLESRHEKIQQLIAVNK